MKNIKWIYGLVFVTTIFMFGGCARVGADFDSHEVKRITLNQTTQEDIIDMFGKPWRKGIENGTTMWSYGRYTYKLFGDSETKDLVVKFNDNGKVSSYTFNETTK
jgi:hypothetical protein